MLCIKSLEFLYFLLQWFWSLGVLSLPFMPRAGLFLSTFKYFVSKTKVFEYKIQKYFGLHELCTEKEPDGDIITCSLKGISNLENL